MMPNQSTDILFQLIRSLEKAEKRNFKLFIQRNSGNKDLKIIELFNAMDKLVYYDESALLKKLTSIEKPQLSNIKSHLYKQILASLRILTSSEGIEFQMNEQLDHARILYNKGLYHQSLKILEKLKETAIEYNQHSFLIQVISFEKKIESLYITRSFQDRAEILSAEAEKANDKRATISRLSNLSLQMYSWYIQKGHARNKEDESEVKKFFYKNLPTNYHLLNGFYERLYIYQSFCWFAYIRQDFLMYYRYTQKWVDLFQENKKMIESETMHFVKGMHNLMNALFDIRSHKKFTTTLETFYIFSKSAEAQIHDNIRIQTFIYLNSARLNHHIISGTFSEGIHLIPEIEKKLSEYSLYIDKHRILVMNYKIAMIYFGAEDFSKSIDYLQKIINEQIDLRIDLQCYSRLLHLIAQYEIGNVELVEYLTKSVYRFMAKMKRFTVIEEEIGKFLRNSFHSDKKILRTQFEQLLIKLRPYETKQFETRTFAYLDVISWLESKVLQKPMSFIIKEKYNNSKR